MTQAKLADECGVGSSTISDIKKNEDKIRSFASTMDSMAGQPAMSKKGHKVIRLADDDRLDKAVYQYMYGCCV